MKFYSKKYKFLVVMDPIRHKRLCKFEDGIYETEDEYIKKQLIDLGFEHEPEPVKTPIPKAKPKQEPKEKEKEEVKVDEPKQDNSNIIK